MNRSPSPRKTLRHALVAAFVLALASAAPAQDSDGDLVDDPVDPAPLDAAVCGDSDLDMCDDCSVSLQFDPDHDGSDFDGDGSCDLGDPDDDDDGVDDAGDSDPLDPLACRDADGDTCDDCSPGHAGVVLYDPRMFYPAVHSGRHDDDWSMRTGVANDQRDWIEDSRVIPLAGSGGALWSRSSGEIWPHASDAVFCRSTSDFSVCPDADAEACDDTLGYDIPDLMICRDASEDEYVTLPIRSMNGCDGGTGPGASSVPGGPKFVAAAGDSCQQAWPDAIHRDTYMSRLIAQGLLNLHWEAAFVPERNLVDDGAGNTGDMEGPDCTGVFPAASDASVAASPSVYDPEAMAAGANNSIHGTSCRLRTVADGGFAETHPLPVSPNTWHTCHFYASSSSASNAIEFRIYDDGAQGTPLPTQTTWHYLENGPLELPDGTTASGQGWNWIYVVQKFFSGPETSVRWRVATHAGSGAAASKILVDDLYCYPSVQQNGDLNHVLEAGPIDLMIAGDSRTRVQPNRLPAAIDERLASGVRPDITLARPALDSRIELVRLDQTQEMGEIAARSPDYAILNAGINGFASSEVATLLADWREALALVPGPVVPIWIGEGAYRGNTSATACAGGPENCATLGQAFVNRLLTTGAFDSPTPDGIDSDADGLCDAGDGDDDGDGVGDSEDPEPLQRYVCGDSDADGCDDCSVVGSTDPPNDGPDFDDDGVCDVTDPQGDADGDGVPDPIDLCPETFDPTNADANENGVGDACETACSNGIDDDGDGGIDLQDVGCRALAWRTESPACSDGIDNDGDGGIDFDGSPPDTRCSQPWLLREAAGHCGLGFELALLMPALLWLRRRASAA